MNDIDIKLRQLARSNYWQNLYQASKECSNLQLFENITNYSSIQVRFLYWLSVYSMLFDELTKLEDVLLTASVIENDLRTDAYLVYRRKKHDYLWKKYRNEEKLAEHKSKHGNKHKSGDTQLIEVDLRREA